MPCHSCPAPLRRTPFSPRRHKAFPVPSGCCAAHCLPPSAKSVRVNAAASMSTNFKVLGDCRVTPAQPRYDAPLPRRHKAFPVPSGCCAALAFRRPVESARSNTAASMGTNFKMLGRVTPAQPRYDAPLPPATQNFPCPIRLLRRPCLSPPCRKRPQQYSRINGRRFQGVGRLPRHSCSVPLQLALSPLQFQNSALIPGHPSVARTKRIHRRKMQNVRRLREPVALFR